MKKHKRSVQIGLGVSSILMIFVILCMMILSTLSYTRALQNEKIAQREKAYQEAYYKADEQASIIYETLKQRSTKENTLEDIVTSEDIQKLYKEANVTYQSEKNKLYMKLHVYEHQYLSIVLEKQNQDIIKKQWKLVSTGGE